MDDTLETYEFGNEILKIYPVNDAESPREWDNFGHMVCFHRRYSLGDKNEFNSPEEFLENELRNFLSDDKAEEMSDDIPKSIVFLEKHGYIFLSLYLYNHSGITMSVADFGDPWDSGQVGWIYCNKKDILKNWGGKIVTAKHKQDAIRIMKAEVEEYDQFLRGDVYGYEVQKKVIAHCEENGKDYTEYEDGDSCWGFYGDDITENGILEQANISDEFRKHLTEKLGKKIA